MKKIFLILSVILISLGAQKVEAGINTESSNNYSKVMLQTKYGKVFIELWDDVAPNHVAAFKERVSEGFYDGMYFHRVIPGFVAQGGDPAIINKPAVNYTLDLEPSMRSFERGVLGAARLPHDKNSASTQFFIMLGNADYLDGDYTAFGKVISGMEFVDKIKKGDKMIKVELDNN